MKSVLSAALLAVALGSLAACSGSDDENIASDVPTPSAAADTSVEAITTTTTPPTTSTSTTTTTVPATTTPPDVGTLANPNPIGSTSGDLGWGWSVVINSVVPDATALVMEEFNDPPAPGTVYMLVSVTATLNGPEEANASDILFFLLGPSKLVEERVRVAVPEPEYPRYSQDDPPNDEVSAGGSMTGNIAFQVPAGADLSTYVVVGNHYYSSADEQYFALV